MLLCRGRSRCWLCAWLWRKSYTPYRIAFPNCGSRKSWVLTSVGDAVASHSTPTFLKLPTNSFCFVSTEMTGAEIIWNSRTVRLMCTNCQSRSGWCFPSWVFRNPYPPASLPATWLIARLGGGSGYSSQRPPGIPTLVHGLPSFWGAIVRTVF
jgi:hypothetical protein